MELYFNKQQMKDIESVIETSEIESISIDVRTMVLTINVVEGIKFWFAPSEANPPN